MLEQNCDSNSKSTKSALCAEITVFFNTAIILWEKKVLSLSGKSADSKFAYTYFIIIINPVYFFDIAVFCCWHSWRFSMYNVHHCSAVTRSDKYTIRLSIFLLLQIWYRKALKPQAGTTVYSSWRAVLKMCFVIANPNI